MMYRAAEGVASTAIMDLFLAFFPFLPYAIKRILDSDYAVLERHDAGISSNDDAFTVRYLFEPLLKRPEWIVKQVNTS